MKKILLVCAAGMSTSLLVTKMKAHATSIEEEIEIEALPVSEASSVVDKMDIVMLGPQVRYQKPQVDELVQGRIPVIVIDMKDYGMLNGKAVLEKAFAEIG
ncbi:PTS sugar transporter subunit IIB [Listeria monocytogenes]|nr:PTS sugar transporter subunit IIB [Listeria monocytogenes]EAE1234796.1 PTS sugar transporter subunit IIB [Listeria monocytogenes]EAE1241163.1 PTS sugar transporter subunit IIB [Listeria monocytogenes]